MAQLSFMEKGPDIVFDLETKRTFDEVGGRDRIADLGISLGIVYDYGDDDYHVYREDEIGELADHILRAGRVIGFNILGFDLLLMRQYLDRPIRAIPSLDLMAEAKRELGFRPSLQRLAVATLGAAKAGDGLEAVRWYREGRIDDLIHYCREDVRITRELYEFGRDRGYLLFHDRGGGTLRVPVRYE